LAPLASITAISARHASPTSVVGARLNAMRVPSFEREKSNTAMTPVVICVSAPVARSTFHK
jgi:hypothetical protein